MFIVCVYFLLCVYSLQLRANMVDCSYISSNFCVTARHNKLCGRPPQYAPAPCKLTFDLLTLKLLVSESRVT